MRKIIEKIKNIRRYKGFSHEYMAMQLNISQVAYSKIERLETKLSVERLFKIAEILEVSVWDILNIQHNNQYSQMIKETLTFYLQQQTENLDKENKEQINKIIDFCKALLEDKDLYY